MAEPEDRSVKEKVRKRYFFKNIIVKSITNPISVLKWIFRYSGLQFICRKFRPVEKSQLPTGVIWLIGIYVAFFGVASQRYENRVDKIENRANAIFPQLSTPVYQKALGRISRVQNMPCPYKPSILNPVSVFSSLFSKDTEYTEMVELLRETIEDWKDSLEGIQLWRANLQGANLREANLEGANLVQANLQEADLGVANLREANLEGANLQEAYLGLANLQEAGLTEANLRGANLRVANLQEAYLGVANLQKAILLGANLQKAKLQGANLQGANLQEADLRRANLQKAKLGGANLQKAKLGGANLQEADLEGANLQGVDITIEQLSKVKTLSGAILDSDLQEKIRKDYPHLLELRKD